MTRNNGSPQAPGDFLAEIQRNALQAVQQESLAPPEQVQPTTSPQEPQSPHDPNVAIVALALFSQQVLQEVMKMAMELQELRLERDDLSKQNSEMGLKIQSLSETVAARDASIKELTARIEPLANEKTKLQTA